VRVRQDRAQSIRLDLIPRFETPIPRAVERVERTVLVLQPSAKARDAIRTETKLRTAHVRRLGPVDDVRLAPQVPSEEGGAVFHALGELRQKTQHRGVNAG